ncbi:hypothetical protein [Pseudarthrobacter sp. S6]|uniref:hypothetical protein n=1 Tax=Pseudarthrobacter sp. S6 TaxID=3418420 RepID=UPI003CFBA87F
MAMIHRVIFVVGNTVQQENAVQVAKHMSSIHVSFLNLWTGKLHDKAFSFDGHSPSVSIRRITQILFRSPITAQDITVIPQDVGLLQRLLVRRAKRAGSLTVLMPDGVAAAGANTNGSRARLALRTLVDTAVKSMGLVEGKAGSMGSSKPHIVASWGAGWDSAFAAGEATEFRHLGCPRMDAYAFIPPPTESTNLLVCSQPLGIPSWSRPYAREWYAFLGELLDQPIPNYHIRVRLHPAEQNDPAVPERLRAAHLRQPLVTDIEWASQVASPFSTVLVEALAADRPFLALGRDKAFEAQANRTPFFADKRITVAPWTAKGVQSALHELRNPAGLREDYLSFIGTSARITGELFETLAAQQLQLNGK